MLCFEFLEIIISENENISIIHDYVVSCFTIMNYIYEKYENYIYLQFTYESYYAIYCK